MSEVFSIFLGCVIYSVTDILFVRIVTKLKSKRNLIFRKELSLWKMLQKR